MLALAIQAERYPAAGESGDAAYLRRSLFGFSLVGVVFAGIAGQIAPPRARSVAITCLSALVAGGLAFMLHSIFNGWIIGLAYAWIRTIDRNAGGAWQNLLAANATNFSIGLAIVVVASLTPAVLLAAYEDRLAVGMSRRWRRVAVAFVGSMFATSVVWLYVRWLASFVHVELREDYGVLVPQLIYLAPGFVAFAAGLAFARCRTPLAAQMAAPKPLMGPISRSRRRWLLGLAIVAPALLFVPGVLALDRVRIKFSNWPWFRFETPYEVIPRLKLPTFSDLNAAPFQPLEALMDQYLYNVYGLSLFLLCVLFARAIRLWQSHPAARNNAPDWARCAAWFVIWLPLLPTLAGALLLGTILIKFR